MADKIVCDEWECVKHRTQTLSRLYKLGELKDSDIHANIGDIIAGTKSARENEEEFIYYNTVGLAFIDVALSKYFYDEVVKNNKGMLLNLSNDSMIDLILNQK